jgi:ribonuclease D
MDQNSGAPPFRFLSFSGKIHLITTDEGLAAIDVGGVREMGFDTETRPSFKKGEVHKVALLQLATDADAYLVRLHHVTRFEICNTILENPGVVKVGAAIHDDLKVLQRLFPFTPRGFVELQQLAKQKGLRNQGLKGMAEEVLGATLTKGPKLTNWEAAELTPPQRMYAATDAWVGLAIYRALNSAGKLQP